MNQSALMLPLRFRFTEEADQAAYGADWHVYDEAAIVRRPARELIKLEAQLGASVADVFQGVRAKTTFGYLAATWIALFLEDPDLAGPFDVYSPIVLLTEWAAVPRPEGAANMVGPFDQTPPESSAEPSPSE